MVARNAGTAANHSSGWVTADATVPAASDDPFEGTDCGSTPRDPAADARATYGIPQAHTGASTSSVSANALQYDTSARRGTVGFAVASIAALTLAARVPLDVVVLGVLLVGTAHVAYELRYVYGRHGDILSGRWLWITNALLAVVVVNRLLVGTTPGTARLEALLLGGLLVAVAAMVASPRVRPAAVALLATATATAVAWPGTWFVVQAHLHNLIPLAFLWIWSNRVVDDRRRRQLRAVCLIWAVALPLVILSGMLDGWLTAAGSRVATDAAEQAKVVKGVVPAGTDAVWAVRLLTAFAFVQILHYTAWCWFFPRHAPDATASFEATAVGRHLRGWRLAAVAATITAVIAAVAVGDYRAGRSTYLSLAAYHAYLEYPVLVAIALVALASHRLRPTTEETSECSP